MKRCIAWERCEEGPRPRAAVQDILRGWWPNRCEDFPDEEPETLGWLGCACWQRDDAGQVWCAR